MGKRPVIRAARLGVHWFSTLKFVNLKPSAASLLNRRGFDANAVNFGVVAGQCALC